MSKITTSPSASAFTPSRFEWRSEDMGSGFTEGIRENLYAIDTEGTEVRLTAYPYFDIKERLGLSHDASDIDVWEARDKE